MKLNRNNFTELTDDEFDLLAVYAEIETSFDELLKNNLRGFDDFISNESFDTLADIDRLAECATKWSHILHAVSKHIEQ